MERFGQIIAKVVALINRPVSPVGLSLFRILFGMVALCEVFQIIYFRQLIFEDEVFSSLNWKSNAIVYLPWIAAILSVVLGFHSRVMSLVCYVYSVVILGGMGGFLYHYDFVITGVFACMIFMPVDEAFSLSRFIKKEGKPYRSIRAAYPFILLFLGVYLVYFDSVFHKFGSTMWMKGLAFWLPCSLPQTSVLNLSPILDIKFLALFAGYCAFAFEFVFSVFGWFRKARWLFICLGLVLHLGIGFAFPIPWFGVGTAIFFVLLVPSVFWRRWKTDEDLSKNEDRRFAYGFIAVVCALCLFQGSLILRHSPFPSVRNQFQKVRKAFGIEKSWVTNFNRFVERGFGLSTHPVYIDGNFRNYNHIIAVRRSVEGDFLPVIGPKGHAKWYNSGRMFVNWSFRSNSPAVNQDNLKSGIEKYSGFWLRKQGVDLNERTELEILVKTIDFSFEWEKGLLERGRNAPWERAALGIWEGNSFQLKLPEIEEIHVKDN